ncbi:2,3,4,5-tetrahydropyridine-2,6-dicarboxylate N-acetyltransferase [Roseobacter fucihabitans]|uniref:Chloramphenicol acetyltransferase n=1 Tax=Roseobacter fucihabitans TaxID=1537242 RepID=A0ABZ2BLP6_9RHOB|nr:CatB-related O-acetyltransferase [Roseobacter litoralis]MBC6963372.1 Chloramphenicol acetyltransferase [Roseobacter litoralis]
MSTDDLKLSFSQAQLKTFAEQGLKLYGLAGTSRLAKGSFVEGPTSLLSTVTPGAFLEVGAFCNLSGGALNNIRVGRYCSMAHGVVTGSHEHPTDWLTTSRVSYYPEVNGWDKLMLGDRAREIHAKKKPFAASCPITTLGHDVWIGQGAFIKSGITIGHGAIIGARATVLKDVPPYAIVVGTPGRVVRLRFQDAVVERLLAVKWWDYNIYDLFDAPMDEIEQCLDALEDLIDRQKVRKFSGIKLDRQTLAAPDKIISALAPLPLAEAS